MNKMNERDVGWLKNAKPWYKKWWIIVVAIATAAAISFGTLFAFQVYKVYKNIKAGGLVTVADMEAQAPYTMADLVDPASPSFGAKDAQIEIVEFGDFNCAKTLAEFSVLREMVNKNYDKVRLYWRNMPVVKEDSPALAKASVCANKQSKFWLFHDKLFQNQGKVTSSVLNDIAESVGLDMKKFNDCLNSKLATAQIKKDYYAAEAGGVSGTPTFFVNGYKFQGALTAEAWDQIIQKFLSVYEKSAGN